MEICESINPPKSGKHDSTCPFCAGDKPQLLNYKTKHGTLKDEEALGQNLRDTGTITADRGKNNVGNIYPLPGGGQPHDGWVIKKEVLLEDEIWMKATPHHLIPGKGAMAKSRIEEWTIAGKIEQDIGYSIDCAQNGIWLPYLPSIYTIKHVSQEIKEKYGVSGSDARMTTFYGTRWEPLHDDTKHDIGYMIMSETSLQFHYTDHDDPYHHIDTDECYDDNAQERCDQLADLMTTFWKPQCEHAKDKADGKIPPPYGLVERINLQSKYMRNGITGLPRLWTEWVTTLVQDFIADLLSGRVKHKIKFLIKKK
jgi:hypothetical protein